MVTCRPRVCACGRVCSGVNACGLWRVEPSVAQLVERLTVVCKCCVSAVRNQLVAGSISATRNYTAEDHRSHAFVHAHSFVTSSTSLPVRRIFRISRPCSPASSAFLFTSRQDISLYRVLIQSDKPFILVPIYSSGRIDTVVVTPCASFSRCTEIWPRRIFLSVQGAWMLLLG